MIKNYSEDVFKRIKKDKKKNYKKKKQLKKMKIFNNRK